MKISSSDLALSSRHHRVVVREVEEHLRTWTGPRPTDNTRNSPSAPSSIRSSAALFDKATLQPPRTTDTAEVPETERHDGVPPRLQVLARMIELITGTKVRVINTRDLQAISREADLPTPPPVSTATTESPPGWGLEYDRIETRHKQESTHFSAHGVIRTSDGREIRFRLSLAMQHVQTESEHLSLRAGNAVLKDPLVLHFDGVLPALTEDRIAFDLDVDGHPEQMPFVGRGSGFLVLDLNGNGRVDDGRELFGALSGDGFSDLAQHDDDGNGWIDGNDAVFDRLQIWQQDAEGRPSLTTLSSRNVGALYLGKVSSPHTLGTGSGSGPALGAVRSSGLYLQENGAAGTMQQIDLLV